MGLVFFTAVARGSDGMAFLHWEGMDWEGNILDEEIDFTLLFSVLAYTENNGGTVACLYTHYCN
jgi:hypothetical protein